MSTSSSAEPRIDRSEFSVLDRDEVFASNDFSYWQSRTPAERLQALELMRQSMFGYVADTERLQRFFEVAQRSPR